MKKYKQILLFPILILLMASFLFSQSESHSTIATNHLKQTDKIDFLTEPEIRILSPTDSTINDFPVLTFMDKNEVSDMVYELFEESYMNQSVRLFNFCQNYLININMIENREP